jgi:RNA polymerase sigma-70 factor (ECF subfamily)
LVRTSLCAEAIRLGRLVKGLMSPAPAEVSGLLALMLLQDSRKEARVDAAGDLVVLEDQDRTLWNQEQISEALVLVEKALHAPGPFGLQAAIAAEHCRTKRADETNWSQIVTLYDLLLRFQPSPVISLNRAVAVAMADGPQRGLALIDELASQGDLDKYHLLHAARADLLRRMGSKTDSAESYQRALELVTNETERRFLERRLREVS